MYTWPNLVNRSFSSALRISMSHPRSSGIRRSALVFTSAMRGCFTTGLVYDTGVVIPSLPANADFGIVAQHEAIGAGLHRLSIDPDIFSDQAVGDTVCQIAQR